MDKLLDDCITQEEYDKNNERYRKEIKELELKESRLNTANNDYYKTSGYLLVLFENAEKLFKVANIQEKRQIVSLLLSNLQINDETIDFTLKKPFDSLLNKSKGSYGWG